MDESSEPKALSPEVVKRGPKVIGVIGPHAIGKDTLIEDLKKELSGDVRVFSIGKFVEHNLIDQPDEKRQEFTQRLIDAGIESEDTRLDVIKGAQLVDEIEHCYENHLPMPQEVADWALQDFLSTCSPDTVVLVSGGPYSELDLIFMEQHNPPSALILLAPTSPEWMEEIPKREEIRGGRKFDSKKYNAQLEWEKWKHRVAKVLRHAHSKGYPIMHVNMTNPALKKDEVNKKLTWNLVQFVKAVREDKTKRGLSKLMI